MIRYNPGIPYVPVFSVFCAHVSGIFPVGLQG